VRVADLGIDDQRAFEELSGALTRARIAVFSSPEGMAAFRDRVASDREGTLRAIVAATLSRALTEREGLHIEVAPETVDPEMWNNALALASTRVDAILAGGECQPDVMAAVLPAELLERAAIAAEALRSNATAALFDRNVARADEMAANHRRRDVPLDVRVTAARQGLRDAIAHWPGRQPFATYSAWWIRQALARTG